MTIEAVGTKDQLADVFTKPLNGPRLLQLLNMGLLQTST